jgi:Holliday junction resolvase RusA-like endonuclease
MKLQISGRVISKKNNWHPVSRGGRTFMRPSKRWSEFEADAVTQLKKQLGTGAPYSAPIYVDYAFMLKGKGNIDTSNMITAIDDLLEKAGVITNDRLVRSGSFRVFEGQPEYATEITIKYL